MVLFSHGFRGINVQSSHLMAALADAGCLVLAPNHADRFTNVWQREPFGGPRGWHLESYRERAEDLATVLSAAQKSRALRDLFQPEQLVLCGHSLGGYICLGLAGAIPAWNVFGLRPRALIGYSPYLRPLLDRKALARVSTPTMLQGGTEDPLSPALLRAGGALDQLAGPRVVVEFQGARHASWTGLERRPYSEMEQLTVAFVEHFVQGRPLDDCLLQPKGKVSQIRWRP